MNLELFYLYRVDLEYQTYEVISDDLGSFLLDRVNFALGSNLE